MLHCRLCAKLKPKNVMRDIENSAEQRLELVNMLIRLNAGDYGFFDDHKLPKTVCLVCWKTLKKAHDFVLSIKRAQEVLVDSIVIDNIKDESMFTAVDICNIERNGSSLYEPKPTKYYATVKTESGNSESHNKSEPDESNLNEPPIEVDIYYNNKLKRKVFNAWKERIKRAKKMRVKNPKVHDLSDAEILLSWKDFTWICSHCTTQFCTITDLQSHSMEYHKSCNAYKCADCNSENSELDSFILHNIRRHRKKYLKFSCYLCLHKSTTIKEMAEHKSVHLNGKHICPGCNTGYSNEADLKQHMATYYEAKKQSHLSILKQITDNLTCLLCNKVLKSKISLSHHLVTHTERKRDHICEKCGKCFFDKNILTGHLRSHDVTDEKVFQCIICGTKFKTKRQLRNHVSVHSNEKPFTCDECGKPFRLKRQLRLHKVVHTDLLPHTCNVCGKKCRSKVLLNQHSRQHTGIKPYSCTVCHREFTNWANCNKHTKRLHGMDLAKKKRTEHGVFPIDPSTGEIVRYPNVKNLEEWKVQVFARKKAPGRPKTINKVDHNSKVS